MLTFDDYKAKISIIQILEDLGYKQDISKGKVSPVFKLTDGAGNKLDEIIIKNPHSVQEHYYDRNYKGGDLIQFIKNHIGNSHNLRLPKVIVIGAFFSRVVFTHCPVESRNRLLGQVRSACILSVLSGVAAEH